MSESTENKEATQPEQEDFSKIKSPIPIMENYIHPIDIDFLKSIEEQVELVLKNYDKKLEQTKNNNLILKHKDIVFKLPEIASLFKEKENLSEINESENRRYGTTTHTDSIVITSE